MKKIQTKKFANIINNYIMNNKNKIINFIILISPKTMIQNKKIKIYSKIMSKKKNQSIKIKIQIHNYLQKKRMEKLNFQIKDQTNLWKNHLNSETIVIFKERRYS